MGKDTRDQALCKSEEFLKDLLESIQVRVCVLDRHGTFQRVNYQDAQMVRGFK